MLDSLADNNSLTPSENPCLQGLGVGEQKPVCKKTCGSVGCKRSFLKQQCPGIYQGTCVGNGEKEPGDQAKANACISSEVDMNWLTKKSTRVADTPFQEKNDWTYMPATSHLSAERYFLPPG